MYYFFITGASKRERTVIDKRSLLLAKGMPRRKQKRANPAPLRDTGSASLFSYPLLINHLPTRAQPACYEGGIAVALLAALINIMVMVTETPT